MADVAKLASATDWREAIAAKLEDTARQIRAGTLVADQGVLILRNQAAGLMHEPHRLGAPSTLVEILGMLAYGQQHRFDLDA